ASFVRPKDVAVDEAGFLYVTDAAFGNVQIFDADLQLLTFVGAGGESPGQFQIASGVAVRGDRFAIVDQLGRRVQVFRYLVPKTAPSPRGSTTAAVPSRPPAPAPIPPAPAVPAQAPPAPARAPAAPASTPPASVRPADPAASANAPPLPRTQPPAPVRAPVSPSPAAQPVPSPAAPKAPPPAVPAASQPRVATLTSVSPSQIRAPGVVELEVKGRGLRPDLQARVSRGGVGVPGLSLVRQRFVDATTFRVTIELQRRASPGACEVSFQDARGETIGPLIVTLTR
ncbi:MAG TPA: hypothetical protein VGB87_12340, partial [Vicinamibacteria bacterium]